MRLTLSMSNATEMGSVDGTHICPVDTRYKLGFPHFEANATHPTLG